VSTAEGYFVAVNERLRQIVMEIDAPWANPSVDGKRKRSYTLGGTKLPQIEIGKLPGVTGNERGPMKTEGREVEELRCAQEAFTYEVFV